MLSDKLRSITLDFAKKYYFLVHKYGADGEGEITDELDKATLNLKSALREEVEGMDIEKVCENVHKAYCKYHKERTGEDYWTKGDYSLLKEDGKEYDRRTVKSVIDDLLKRMEGVG